MDIFSLKNWLDLKDRQLKHSIFDCNGCLRNESWKNALAMFPVRGFLQHAKVKRMGLVERNVLQDKTKVSYNFYKAGETSPRNAKTTGNRKINKKRLRESVGRHT